MSVTRIKCPYPEFSRYPNEPKLFCRLSTVDVSLACRALHGGRIACFCWDNYVYLHVIFIVKRGSLDRSPVLRISVGPDFAPDVRRCWPRDFLNVVCTDLLRVRACVCRVACWVGCELCVFVCGGGE